MLDKINIVLYPTVLKLISYDLLVNYFTAERLQSFTKPRNKNTQINSLSTLFVFENVYASLRNGQSW